MDHCRVIHCTTGRTKAMNSAERVSFNFSDKAKYRNRRWLENDPQNEVFCLFLFSFFFSFFSISSYSSAPAVYLIITVYVTVVRTRACGTWERRGTLVTALLRNEWTTAGEVDKIEQFWGNVLTYTTKHKETQTLSTENCLHQVWEDRQITIKEEGNKEEDRQEGADVTKITSSFLSVFFASFFFYYHLSSYTWWRQFSVESACVSLFPCVSSYRWVYFPKSVLFCII